MLGHWSFLVGLTAVERGWYGDRNTDSACFVGDCICWNDLGIQVLLE